MRRWKTTVVQRQQPGTHLHTRAHHTSHQHHTAAGFAWRHTHAPKGSAFSGGRLAQAAATTGDFPKCLAVTRGTRTPTPARALVFQAALAVVLIAMGNFERLLTAFSVVAWIFYLQAVTCLFALRLKEPTLHRPFKVWLGVSARSVSLTHARAHSPPCFGSIRFASYSVRVPCGLDVCQTAHRGLVALVCCDVCLQSSLFCWRT